MELLRPLADSDFPGATVAYTGTAGSTSTWNAGPQGVTVWSTTACYVLVGEGATATTSSTPIPANTPIHFTVPQGTGAPWRVSAIQVSSGGSIYCKPINIR
jgi:hypothetical protein